jgi:hypothetical protein
MTLNTYVQSFIGGLSGTLGWGSDTINFVVEEALETYGVATEAEATDAVKVHALLRYKTVERILIDVSQDYDYKADGESFSRSQFFENIEKMRVKAFADAFPYLPQGEIEQGRITFVDDPYSIDGQKEHDA